MPTDEPDFETVLRQCFEDRIKSDDKFCEQLWSALANVTWYHRESRAVGSFSFRYAGGVIADIRGSGNYLDWYCIGPYATVSDEIRRTLSKAGWIPDEFPGICDEPGCLNDVGCGWPSPTGYRIACGEHWQTKG